MQDFMWRRGVFFMREVPVSHAKEWDVSYARSPPVIVQVQDSLRRCDVGKCMTLRKLAEATPKPYNSKPYNSHLRPDNPKPYNSHPKPRT